ncbi:MAG: hypothetical protein IPM02_23815 [Betaproteobacteria bacterium]|nr:hypothetical protein [Betaproteobacteria bacterium]
MVGQRAGAQGPLTAATPPFDWPGRMTGNQCPNRQSDDDRRTRRNVAAQGSGLLPIEGDAYYSTSQLSQPPVPLNEVALDDPAVAPVIASGKMVMTLWINAHGEVENAVVDETELPGLFTRPTVEAFKRLRFRPGELGGRSVGSIMKIEVTYEDERALPACHHQGRFRATRWLTRKSANALPRCALLRPAPHALSAALRRKVDGGPRHGLTGAFS